MAGTADALLLVVDATILASTTSRPSHRGATTPHEAMVAWGAAVAAARVAWVQFHAAERAHDKAAEVFCLYGGHSGVVETELFEAMRAAGTAEEAAYAVYDDAAEVAVSARGAVCDAYDHAGFPQAFLVLEAIAPHWKDWSPDLEDTLAALLSAPART